MREQVHPQDRRVIRTRKSIRNALARLLAEKDLNDITVSDIAQTADINRKTFYNYYSGIHEIIDEIENDIVDSFGSVLGDINFKECMKKPNTIFEKLTSIINTDMDFYGYFLSMNSNTNMLHKIVHLLKERTKSAMLTQTDADSAVVENALTYALYGMIAVFQQWFNSDRTQSIEEISELISVMCFNGLSGIINTK